MFLHVLTERLRKGEQSQLAMDLPQWHSNFQAPVGPGAERQPTVSHHLNRRIHRADGTWLMNLKRGSSPLQQTVSSQRQSYGMCLSYAVSNTLKPGFSGAKTTNKLCLPWVTQGSPM